MTIEYRLVGLSIAKEAVIELVDSDKDTFILPVDMPQEVFKEMFDYCKGNWKDPKMGVVECMDVNSDGWPIHGVLKSFYEV